MLGFGEGAAPGQGLGQAQGGEVAQPVVLGIFHHLAQDGFGAVRVVALHAQVGDGEGAEVAQVRVRVAAQVGEGGLGLLGALLARGDKHAKQRLVGGAALGLAVQVFPRKPADRGQRHRQAADNVKAPFGP